MKAIPGIYKVRSSITGTVFMLSIVEAYAVFGFAWYEIGGKRPRRGKHKMLDAANRETLLNQLETVE